MRRDVQGFGAHSSITEIVWLFEGNHIVFLEELGNIAGLLKGAVITWREQKEEEG